MDPEQIFRKSPKGREEIEKRTLRLEARRRSLLILVDGRLTVAELAEKTPHLDTANMIQALLNEGFLEPADGSVPVVAPETPPLPNHRSLDELKRAASREIERLMGPNGEALAIRIEGCTTLEAFTAEAQRARDALGPRQGEAFWKAISS